MNQTPRFDNCLLMTAVVNVVDNTGKSVPCRAFLDSGSQANLVSKSFVKRLNLPVFASKTQIVGANGTTSTLCGSVKLKIYSRCSDFQTELDCLVADEVTGTMPSRKFDVNSWDIPQGFYLADSSFNIPGSVDLLIGIEQFFKLMLPGQFALSDKLPILQETHLGWVCTGSVEHNLPRVNTASVRQTTKSKLESCNDIFSGSRKYDTSYYSPPIVMEPMLRKPKSICQNNHMDDRLSELLNSLNVSESSSKVFTSIVVKPSRLTNGHLNF